MNELLFRILEHNKFIFMAFVIIGEISFFCIPSREMTWMEQMKSSL